MEYSYRHNPNHALTHADTERLRDTEWLVTNGLGGYASGTVGGTPTRVFHGYLIAALPSPLGRTMMLNDILETLMCSDGRRINLNIEQKAGEPLVGGSQTLASFRLDDAGLPVWTYEINGMTLEKRVVLPHGQNTTYINYRIAEGQGSCKLQLRPAVNIRGHETPVNTPPGTYTLTVRDHNYEIQSERDFPPLKISLEGNAAAFAIDPLSIDNLLYTIEEARGYIHQGDLWSPGYFSIELDPSHDATLIASTENWDIVSALTPKQALDAEHDRERRLLLEAHPSACRDDCRDLVAAADQFVITPVGRQADTARARAAGDEIRTIVAGYHWFTDWGRDTMISLEGLTLVTGRQVEASYILRTFAHYIRDGLIPNMFPEGKTEGLYHTADATLWFFHAAKRYFDYTRDRHLLTQLLPKLLDIVGHHLRGTHFGIHVDPSDGLLVQGQEGCQLTWMDAKVDGWVVTPRRGKAVEINALWYNALRILEHGLRQDDRADEADGIAEHAEKARASFNNRFWYEAGGYLYDVVDCEHGGNDPACRPNQLFAISLDYPVLDSSRWEAVVRVSQDRLLTPVGLRSLAPGDKDFNPRYDGDLRSRDAAYHQGTVWAWLIGPFIDAWLKLHPDDLATARGFLAGFKPHLRSACVGSISEIFDAEPPFTPRGCCAQAWSVAEVLRCYIKTAKRPTSRRETPVLSTVAAD